MTYKKSGNYILGECCEQKETMQLFLDALPYSAAVLDDRGFIVSVNQEWKNFARENGLGIDSWGLGSNYLDIAENTDSDNAARARRAIDGIRAVMDERRDIFSLSYPCHSPRKKRWFKMKVKKFKDGVLVLHENITEQKNLLRELIDSEQKYRSMINNAFEMIYLHDTDGNIIEVNQAVYTRMGYTEAHIGQLTIFDLHPGQTGVYERQEIKRLWEKWEPGKRVLLERAHKRKDGTTIPVDISTGKISYGGEEYILAFARDVTEKRMAQKDLQQSKENLEATLNSIGDAVIATNTAGEITRINPVAERLTGWTAVEAVGKPLKEVFKIINAQTGEPAFNPVEDVLQTGKKVGLANHTVLIARDGSEYQIADSAAPIHDVDNNVIGVVLVFRDVTEQYQMREKLEASEDRFQKMLSVIPDMVSIHDREMNIIYSNWKGLASISPGKRKLKTKCHKTYRGYEDICPDCQVKTLLETKAPVQEEKRLPGGNWYDIRAIPMTTDDNGNVELFVEWVKDITDSKKWEEKIRYISFHDSMTDIYNRTYIERKLKEVDKKENLPLSIVMVDINGLKIINEAYGHQKGDEILKHTAELLLSCCGDEGIVGRWAGDEFIILLPRIGVDRASKLVYRLIKECRENHFTEVPLSFGIGAATKSKVKEDIYDILHKADDRVYKDKLTKNRSAKNRLVQNMLNTLGAKSDETKEHAQRMTVLSYKLGENIGLDLEQLNNLSLLASLHDIGKVNIAENILKKPSGLTENEWELIKEHTKKGQSIAAATEEFAPIAEGILSHHERWDGDGYPRGLKGEEIPLLARVISIVDAYDVMTNGRPYKEPISKEEALAELKRCAGTQFDPELVKIFTEIM